MSASKSAAFTKLKSVSSFRDQARLSTLVTPHTGAKLGLSMSREELLIAIWVFSGIPLFPPLPNVSHCSCEHILNVFGDRLLCCGTEVLGSNAMMLYTMYYFNIF